ncbi:helix-turn-helix domain-containing protein [Hymenobacter crusticola]|uniref:HTH cro/C1-type domain-containing protein n=1 Tax=Hymenobacter crusticola TaxID=1770526 RepID=A0A243W6E4_9BACT|nr:helix-turn-helix transcriptional regulator [Hymenobacter crusticola]OUJ69926.1 hypothetical protein BXP70_25635 [Hymenobacter crusticola]
MEKLNERVRAIRLAKSLTQEQVGVHLSTTKANYNRIEKGHVKIDAVKLAKLADLFEMTPEAIETYRGEDQRTAERIEIEYLRQLVATQQRYIQQSELLLTESYTFFNYCYELLVALFPTDGENTVSLTEINRVWSKLVSYSLADTDASQQAYAEHRIESPLRAAKLGYFDSVVMAMRSLLYFHQQGQAPQE